MSNTPTPNLSANPETPSSGTSPKIGAKSELQTTPKTTSAPYAQLRLWLRDLVISVILAVFVIIFLYQPVCLPAGAYCPWRRGGIPLSPRYFEELYQAGDWYCRGPHSHCRRRSLFER